MTGNTPLKLISMSEINAEEVQWLWYPYIPLGKLTIIQGDPGEGKTSFILAVIAALTRGVKEAAADSPLTQALSRCYQRIDKDKARGIITAEEQMRLRAKAEELYHEARTQPGMPYEAFNESLATRNLYPLCGVQRKSKPVGRPRKQN